MRLIEREKTDTIFMVPTMLIRLLNLPEDVRRKYDMSSHQPSQRQPSQRRNCAACRSRDEGVTPLDDRLHLVLARCTKNCD